MHCNTFPITAVCHDGNLFSRFSYYFLVVFLFEIMNFVNLFFALCEFASSWSVVNDK